MQLAPNKKQALKPRSFITDAAKKRFEIRLCRRFLHDITEDDKDEMAM